jgi:predicted transcriptional regulator
MSKDKWTYIAWLKRGSNRLKVFKAIDGPTMPSEIVLKIFGKPSSTNFTLVSRALAELVKEGLIKIKNPNEKTGRLYELTDKGKKMSAELVD